MSPRKYFNIILLPVLLAAAIFFSGCFDVKREIKMYPDGTGLEDMYVTLDKEFYERLNILATSDMTGMWKKSSIAQMITV